MATQHETGRAAKAPGRIGQALLRLLMRRATVIANERLSDRFRLITLEGPALAGLDWVPGQKIQIAMGSAFVARTHTPIEWNAEEGRTCILGYAHGDGPGSAWLQGAVEGDGCDLFGPRGSLDVRAMPGPLALFGDETSIGLAYALARTGRAITCHFETQDADGTALVLDKLGLGDAALVARRADETHLDALAATLPDLAASGASFVLTGRAAGIQRLRQALKRAAVPAGRVATKAYWAPGKTGLD